VGAVYRTRGGQEATITRYVVCLGASSPVCVTITAQITEGQSVSDYALDEEGNYKHLIRADDQQFDQEREPGNHPLDLMTQIKGPSIARMP